MSFLARLSTGPDRDAQFAAIQQHVADSGADIGVMLAAIADGVMAMVPAATGVAVRIGPDAELGADRREVIVGVYADPALIVPILQRSLEIGDIRVHARRPMTAADQGAVRLLAGLAAIAVSTGQRAEHAYDALDRYQRRLHATFSQAPVGMAHVAPDGRFLLINDRYAAITGYSREALMEHGFQCITHPDDLEADRALLVQLVNGDVDNCDMEKRYVRADGTDVWVRLTVSLVRDAAGAPDFFVGMIEDMSAIRAAHEAAIRDPLTGLLNRRGFAEICSRVIELAAHGRKDVVIAYLDLDGFKHINDVRGHAAGDDCLIAVAQAIGDILGSSAIPARLGGDEFVMLMPRLSIDHAGHLMDQLRARLSLSCDGLTGSFGIVQTVPGADTDIMDLIAMADQAMFGAKHAGRNCVRVVRC